jgi:putative chitinase
MKVEEIVTKERMVKYGFKESVAEAFLPYLIKYFDQFQINTPLRICHFFGQTVKESVFFTKLQESLNYSPEVLLTTFPSRVKTIENARELVPDKVKMCEVMYGGRFGNKEYGDGFKYRGRGIIHNTFLDNYQYLTVMSGVDFVNNPDLLLQPEYAVIGACLHWKRFKINLVADTDSVIKVTKAVNGSSPSERSVNERIQFTKLAKQIFK